MMSSALSRRWFGKTTSKSKTSKKSVSLFGARSISSSRHILSEKKSEKKVPIPEGFTASDKERRAAVKLYEMAYREQSLESTEKDLKGILNRQGGETEFSSLLGNVLYKDQNKLEKLKQMDEGVKNPSSKTTSSFLDLLVKEKRLANLLVIAKHYMTLMKKHRKEVDITIQSPLPLHPMSVEHFINKLKEEGDLAKDAQVTPRTIVDKSIWRGYKISEDGITKREATWNNDWNVLEPKLSQRLSQRQSQLSSQVKAPFNEFEEFLQLSKERVKKSRQLTDPLPELA